MSLRELPPDQAINPSRWRHLRYVPLVILVVLSLVAAGVGVAIKVQNRLNAAAAPVVPTAPAVADRLPEQCHPAVDVADAQPWSAQNTAASEQVWNDNAAAHSDAFVEGKDDWVFWGDIQNNNFSQAIGRRYLSPEELARWTTYLTDLDTRLTAEGIEFYIAIAPAKWAIYPDELPEWAQQIRGAGPLDQLMAAGGNLPLVDLRAPLQQASETAQTYSRGNSHWSSYGAYEGWNAIASCITANQPDVALSPIPITGVTIAGGFNEFSNYGFADPKDWTAPAFTQPLAPVELSAVGADPVSVSGDRWTSFDDLPAVTTNANAQSDKSVLFVGDSFGIVMSPYLQQAFSDVRQVRHNLDGDPSIQPDIFTIASATRPDIVILEITQRHLNAPPLLP